MKIKSIKNTKGITLIALIITIILMLILAGVVISLAIGKNGLFKVAKYAVQKNSEQTARERLELVLADLQARKYTDEDYDENEYIDKYLINEGITISDNIALVDGWRFTIDRSVPQIGKSLGKEEIRVTKIVREYLGKDENGKYIADVTIIVESDKAIESVIFQEQDGTLITVTTSREKYKITKDMKIELDKEYKIVINTSDGKSEEKTVIEKLPDLGILISTPYVGTSSFTTKVQYISNEEEVESYTYIIDSVETKTIADKEYTTESGLEPETTYTVKAIVKYKNNLTVESNIVTIKTEPRTYLYNNGDECIDITGGWVVSRYCENQDGKFYYSYLPDSGWNGAQTVNEIDYDSYKKIGVLYNDENTASINFIISDYPFSTTNWLQWAYTSSASSFNLEHISNQHVFWFYAPDEGKCLSINSIWLEK